MSRVSRIERLDGPFGNPYRTMQQQRIGEMLAQIVPRTLRFIPGPTSQEACAEALSTDAFRTRYYRDAAWRTAQVLRAKLPSGWVRDLLDYESALWRAGYLESEASDTCSAFDWPMGLRLHPTLERIASDYAIHENFAETPERKKTFLCVYRRADHAIETRWMGADEFAFLAAIDAQKSALELLRYGVEKCAERDREKYVYQISDFVVQMIECGALLPVAL